MERNRIELTGTVERLRSIPTKTGVEMAKWFLKVGDSRFQCVAFGNLAVAILAAGDGRTVGIVGQGAINSWKTEDGAWRNDFQVSAWAIEIDGVTIAFEKGGSPRRPVKGKESGGPERPTPESRDTDEFQYHGGPF